MYILLISASAVRPEGLDQEVLGLLGDRVVDCHTGRKVAWVSDFLRVVRRAGT